MSSNTYINIPDSGVTDINTVTGSVTLAAGTGVTIIPVGNTLTISSTSGGTVTSVTASTPLVSSGGATPNLTIQQSSTNQNGYLSSTDWNTFNGKQTALTFNTPLVNTSNAVSIPVATTSVDGYLVSSDWNTFNGKANLTSPAFTGIPTAPTAPAGTSTTQLATTAFVLGQGFLGATGSMPFAHASSTSVVTNATATYSTAISTTITVTASSAPVYAKATGTFTVTGAVPTVLKYRVSVNGVAGQEQLLSLTALTTNYTATVQYISAALGPGTYNVLFEIARNSGTGTVSFFEGTLDAIALQGTSSNGITQLTGNVIAGPGSGSQVATIPAGTITNAMVSATAGIAFSKLAALTSTNILVGNVSNVATAVTLSGDATLSNAGVMTIANNAITNVKVSAVDASKITTGTLPFVRGGTGTTAFANQRIPFSNGTNFTTDGLFTYDTTNTIFSVGGSGTAKINAVNSSGSHTALQAYNSSAGNAFQAVNVSAYTAALISRQNNATTGASIGMEFGRGTPATPTQALNGDQIGVIVATPDASDGVAHGYCGSISFVASEDATTTATGGEIVFGTTPNGTLAITERVRIKNSGEMVFQKAIATAQYTTANKLLLTPSAGWVVFDTTLNQLSYYNGTSWINL